MLWQLVKFGIVGVIAAVVDVSVLVACKEWLHFGVLTSSALGFSVSVVVNYLLSMAFVFKSKGEKKGKEFFLFVLLSIGGLILNQAILWVGEECFSLHYLIFKGAALVLVPVYNFITRKLFLEAKEETR